MAIKMNMPDETPKGRRRLANAKGHKVGEVPPVPNSQQYTSSACAHVPITRNAQFAGGGANVAISQPMFFSPLHTPQNWQIASRRKEVYQWARFYYENEPKVAAGVDFYSMFPMNGFELECKVKSVRHYFEELVKTLKLNYWLKLISHEYYLIGDVFPFLEIECKHCFPQGTMVMTSRGNRDISSIKVGDSVLTKGRTFEEVIATQSYRYNGEFVTIKAQCLPPIRSTSDHEHFVVRPEYRDDNRVLRCNWSNFIKISASEIREGDYIATPLCDFLPADTNHVCFDGSEYRLREKNKARHFDLAVDEELSTLLGWYVAEGSTGKSRSFSFALNANDERDIGEMLRQILLKRFDQNTKVVESWCGGNSFCIEGYDVELSRWFEDLCGKGASAKKVPAFIFSASKQVKQAFIDALRKGDGHARRNEFSLTTVSRTLCYDVIALLADLGITAYVSEKDACIDTNGVNHRHTYTVCWRQTEKRLNGQGTHKESSYAFFKVRSSEIETSEETVYNFTVANDHSYVANWMITHNCNGSGRLPDGKVCNHPDGRFKSLIVLNPDFIEIEDSPFPEQKQLFMIPDDKLKRIISTGEPKAVFDRIPISMKSMIASGQRIPLSSRSASHIKHSETPYGMYGTSMLRRLFTVLAYKTKLMTANWIIAERLVLPVRVVKLGEKDRPAGPEDIADMQAQMAAVANDPNLTIVTHHAFDYEWFGATGKIHNIQGELELIGKEILDGLMLNQALLNGEMSGYCLSEDTRTLTDNGLKFHWEIDPKADRIACYNPQTQRIEYHLPYEKVVYDYEGEMVHFQTDKIDILVTPNHRMWCAQRDNDEFGFVKVRDVRARARFIGTTDGFDGDYIPSVDIAGKSINIDDFCELIGYFVSEGYVTHNVKSRSYKFALCQSSFGKARGSIRSLMNRVYGDSYSEYDNEFALFNKDVAEYFRDRFGRKAQNKFIPSEIKNLPTDKLEIILTALIAGDGYISKKAGRSVQQHIYYTSSRRLADDVAEIAFKCGYAVKVSKIKSRKKFSKNARGVEIRPRHQQYAVYFSTGFKGRRPTLQSKSAKYAGKEISKVEYSGKIYCFSVPHELFVTERNGKFTIQGNTSAQVGIETLIKRLETWRNTLSEWVEEHIFKPTAQMQGFIDEEATEQLGKTVYLYPKIKWNDLQLRDKTNKLQMFMQLHDKGLISTETLLNEFDLDYDQEIERIRSQQAISSPGGVAGGAGGGMSGGMGAPGGGAPPMDMGGGMGGPPMGGDPMGGGGGGMGAPMGGGGGGAPMGAAAGGSPEGGKVFKKGKAPKPQKPQDMHFTPPAFVKLTRIEQKMYHAVSQMKLPFKLYGQYKLQVPGEQQPFVMDFAMPEIMVDLECDGAIWHEQEGAKERDAERDRKLAANGWRVIRFTEDAINEHLGEVQKVIEDNVKEAADERFSQRKKASGLEDLKVASASGAADEEKWVDVAGLLDYVQLQSITPPEYIKCGSGPCTEDSWVQVVKLAIKNDENSDIQFEPFEDGGTEEDQGSRDSLDRELPREEQESEEEV